MSKGIFVTIAGALEIVGGIVAAAFGMVPLAEFLIVSGAGMLLSGIGTMMQKGPLAGFATATRNPIAPWTVVYGRARVGGTIIYFNSFGKDRSFLDLVIVLACHPCEAVDDLLFDQQRVHIGPNKVSYVPAQQAISISSIVRANGLTTVTLSRDIPLLKVGDSIFIENVGSDHTMNGLFPVSQIITRVGGITFTYINGGTPISISSQGNVRTNWANFGNKVYMETMLGGQTLGTTFTGMTAGTPNDGDRDDMIMPNPQPWTSNCSLVGHTAVFLRLHYDDQIFSGGIPQISFRVRGKNDIRDARTSPPTYAYTENAALICADYVAQPVWGFKALYETEIPIAPLISAANICDEPVQLAAPLVPATYEPRYTCNGAFQLTTKRGEVLQNLLTSMGGRLSYTGGQFVFQPAYWPGVSFTVSSSDFYSTASQDFQWRPTVSISALFNGVKGTYISPANNWQSSDFPRYAQDTHHGYSEDDNLIADGGDRRWLDVQFPFTISCATAQRLAKIELLRRRYQGTGTFSFNMSAYRFATLDILALSLSYFGWSGKYLEILASRFKMEQQQLGDSQQGLVLGVEVDVQETDPAIYSWSYGEELSAAGYQQAIVPNMKKPAPPTNLRISNGNPVLTWTAPDDSYVLNGGHIEARYQLISSPPGLWISLGNLAPSVTTLFIPDMIFGNNYYVQLRSVNAAGVPSNWVSITAVGPPVHQWAPAQIQAPHTDALFPDEWTFDLLQAYTATSGADWVAIASAIGKQPVNKFIPHCPQVSLTSRNFSVSPTGGHIPGGTIVYVSVGVTNADNLAAPPSTVVAISIPAGTNTNSITIGNAAADILGTFFVQPADGAMLNIADKMYTLQETLTNVDGNVLIGATLADTISNLVAAINLSGGAGTLYAASMTAHTEIRAEVHSTTVIRCIALTPGTSGNSLTASGIAEWDNRGEFIGGEAFAWPVFENLTHYAIYASTDYDLICSQQSGTLTPVTSTTYTPTSLTLTGPFSRSTYALPVDTTRLVRLRAATLIHGGVQGAAVDFVNGVSNGGANVIQATQCIDVASIDDWNGRKIAIIGRNNSSAPFVSFDVTHFDPTTGFFSLSHDPLVAGVEIGDAMVVCTKGVDNSADRTVVTDPGLANSQDVPTPHAGLIVNDPVLQGAVLRVIAGTSRGMAAHIVSNTTTSLTLDSEIIIDSSSVWIILGSTWPYSADSDSTDNGNAELPVQIDVQVSNAVGSSIVVVGIAVDSNGNEAIDNDSPIRMLYVFGAGMAEVVVSSAGSPPVFTYQMLPTEQVVMVDASGGDVTIILPDQVIIRRSSRYVKKTDSSSNSVFVTGYGSPPQTIDGFPMIELKEQDDALILVPNS